MGENGSPGASHQTHPSHGAGTNWLATDPAFVTRWQCWRSKRDPREATRDRRQLPPPPPPPPPVPQLSCCIPTVVPLGGPVALPLEASAWRSAAPSTHQFASGAGPGFYKGTEPKHPPLGLGFAIFKKVPILSILTPRISMMIFVLPGLF